MRSFGAVPGNDYMAGLDDKQRRRDRDKVFGAACGLVTGPLVLVTGLMGGWLELVAGGAGLFALAAVLTPMRWRTYRRRYSS